MAHVAKETASMKLCALHSWVILALLLRVRGEPWLESKLHKLAKECLYLICPLTCENIHY